MNLHIGREPDAMNDRMETELSGWLRSLEPAGTPISLRLRTFADLRKEAERARQRFPWLLPALSSMASLGAIALGFGLIMLLAIAGATTNDNVGGPTTPPVADQLPNGSSDPIAFLVYLAASVLAGAVVLVKPVRVLASRLAFGRGDVAAAAILPLKVKWRALPRLTWILGLLTIVSMLAATRLLFAELGSREPSLAIGFYVSRILASPVALVVAWRYPRHDRASRLLLYGAIAVLIGGLLSEVLSAVDWNSAYVPGFWWSVGLVWLISACLGLAMIIAGLAGRCGFVPRPPLRLGAVMAGAAFFLAAHSLLLGPPVDDGQVALIAQLYWMALGLTLWVSLFGSLAILWIGLSAVRRRPSWTWALVLCAGVLQVSTNLPSFLFQVLQPLLPQDLWSDYLRLAQTWMFVAACLANAALLMALLGGLRPVVADDASPSTESMEPAAPPESAEGAGTPTEPPEVSSESA